MRARGRRPALERLRAVPSTTPLNGPPIVALDVDGSAVFPAFGTAALVEPSAPAPEQQMQAGERRIRPYGLLTAAAAVVALGAVGGTVASTNDAGPRNPAPNAPVRVQPVGSSTADLFVQPAAGPALVAHIER